ncbi:hypothetical protein [Cellulomonas soli]
MPEPVDVLDAGGVPVGVDARCRLTAAPATVRWRPHGDPVRAVVGWAGPWLLTQRWWVEGAGPRAHLQVTLDEGQALLLAGTRDGWVCEATYD